MAQPQYDLSHTSMPLSGGPPVQQLTRGWGPRLALLLLVLPLALVILGVSGLGMASAARFGFKAETLAGPMLGVLAALALFALVAWRMWAEFGRSAALYEQGIELTTYRGTTTIRWEEVEELWFFAQRVQAGGLLGMAIHAGIDRLRKNRNMEERGITINFRVVGGGKKLVLSNYDKGVLAAWQEAMRRVNPRLVAAAVEQARAGQTVSFGKKAVSITASGLSFGKKAEVPWSQITKISIENGQLVAKVTGKWLRSGAMIARLPNLFVLTAAISQLAGDQLVMDVQPGINLAQRIGV